MGKLWALYHNELIKISKKVSIIVMVSLITLMIVGVQVLQLIDKKVNGQWQVECSDRYYFDDAEFYASNIESIKYEIKDMAENGADEQILTEYSYNLSDAYREYYRIIMAKEGGYEFLSTSDYRFTLIVELSELKASLETYKYVNEVLDIENDDAYVDSIESKINNYGDLYVREDYAAYLDICNELIRSDTSMSEEEKKIELEANDLRLSYSKTGKAPGEINNTITSIAQNKRILATGVNGSASLTEADRKIIIDQLAIMEKKIEKGIVVYSDDYGKVSVYLSLTYSSFLLVTLLMIIAGSSVSHEVSTGSIKSLIIAPVKRHKIFTAKILSVLSVGLVIMLYSVALSELLALLFFGSASLPDYVTAVNGKAIVMSHFVFTLLNSLLTYVKITVFAVFAMMLSVLTKNTAASVSITMCGYFGGLIAHIIISAQTQQEWMRFLPFANLSLTSLVFPYSHLNNEDDIMSALSSGGSNSLTFSIIYIVVILGLMIYSSYDSFCRKDIK